MNQEIITKHIDDAIWKCQRLMLTANVNKTFNDFHDTYCDDKTKVEHGIITDIDGNILWEGTGNESSLTVMKRLLLQLLNVYPPQIYWEYLIVVYQVLI